MIIVHATPRTGGVSLRHVVKGLGLKVDHAHYLANRYYYQRKPNVNGRINKIGRENIKIISTVRDPIARNLSEYWRLESIDRSGKPPTEMRIKRGLNKKSGTHAEKFYAFIDHYRQHHFIGSELIPFWGINVFAKPFNPPWQIYDDRLLLIRTEDLTEHGLKALSVFLGVEIALDEMPKLNTGPDKREPINLTVAYKTAMYQDGLFPQKFYSEEEIECFKSKW